MQKYIDVENDEIINCATKGDLAKDLYPNDEFDYALPVTWLKEMSDKGFGNVSPHFVMLYPKNGTPYPAPLTVQGIAMISRAAFY